MEQLFRDYWWIITIPVGIVIPVIAILSVFSTRQKALEVLKAYAERGEEPPPGVLKALNGEPPAPAFEPIPRFGFFLVLGLGCGFMWWYLAHQPDLGLFALLFFIAMMVFAAMAVSNLLRALTSRRP